MKIDPLDLLFPDRLSALGREFVDAHGLDSMTLEELRRGAELQPNGHVRIFHRCQHLTDKGLCDIYAERPQICKDFRCSDKPDCTRDHGDSK